MSRAWNVDDCKYIFGTYTTVYYTSTYRVSYTGHLIHKKYKQLILTLDDFVNPQK